MAGGLAAHPQWAEAWSLTAVTPCVFPGTVDGASNCDRWFSRKRLDGKNFYYYRWPEQFMEQEVFHGRTNISTIILLS